MNDITPTASELRRRAAYYRKRASEKPGAAQAASYKDIAEILDREADAIEADQEAGTVKRPSPPTPGEQADPPIQVQRTRPVNLHHRKRGEDDIPGGLRAREARLLLNGLSRNIS